MTEQLSAALRKAISQHEFAPDRIVGHNVKKWSSASFTGTSHEMRLEFEGRDACDRGARWCGILNEWSELQDIELGETLCSASIKNSQSHFWHDGEAMDVIASFLFLDKGTDDDG